LKNTKIRYALASLHTTEFHDSLMLEAVKQGVAGNGLNYWMFETGFTAALEDRPIEIR
jgi:hypothetical protein